MKVQTTLDSIPAVNRDPIWKRFKPVFNHIVKVLNYNIEFGNPNSGPANIKGNWVTAVTPATANTDFTITHNLGYPVNGIDMKLKNAACDIYTSPTVNPNPNTQFILRATGVSVSLTMFVH
jgi:hypothetical protein